MKGIAAISIAIVLVVLSTLTTSCGRGGNLEGKIKWTESEPSIYLYSQSGPPEKAYKVYISGQATNVTKDKLEVFSVVIKLYNSADEKLGEETFDRSHSPEFYPGDAITMSFIHYYAEAVARYDVFVTDSQSKEYACALAVGLGKGKMAEDLDGKIKWTELNPFTSVYRQDVAPENPYEVNISGQLTNVSQENVNVTSLIFRLYNQAGEMKDAKTFDHRDWYGTTVMLIPGEEGWGAIFNQFFAEEIVRYDVLVTDSQGKEYPCFRD